MQPTKYRDLLARLNAPLGMPYFARLMLKTLMHGPIDKIALMLCTYIGVATGICQVKIYGAGLILDSSLAITTVRVAILLRHEVTVVDTSGFCAR